jgi:hypothetical protein
MTKKNLIPVSCECGKRLTPDALGAPGNPRELTCGCGRKYELELGESGWAPRADPLTPEAQQPLAGFSRDLKLREDCERYFFSRPISGHRLPVHILFSPSAQEAEVKTGDRKAFWIAPVSSPLDARRQWVTWFDSLPGRGDWLRRSHRERSAGRFQPNGASGPRERPVNGS